MTSIETLDLQKAFVIHAGRDTFPLHKQVLAVAANDLLAHVPEP